jgi:hypothetical protein
VTNVLAITQEYTAMPYIVKALTVCSAQLGGGWLGGGG